MSKTCLLAIDEPLYEDSPDEIGPLKDDVKEYLGDFEFVEFDPRWLGSSRMPSNLALCIVDFGGQSSFPGADRGSMYARNLIKAIEERPGTLFLVWSSFTARHYRNEILEILETELGKEVDADDFKCPANVIMYPPDWEELPETWAKAKAWLGSQS